MAVTIRHNSKPFGPRRRLFSASSLPSPPQTSPIPSSPSRNPISRLKSALRAESDPNELLSLFQSSTHLPHFYHARPLFRNSVHKLARCRRPDLVERLLESQKTDPAAPKSEGFFIRIMSLYTSSSMPDHAAATFHQIPVPRTERSLCALLTAYLKHGRYDRVVELFRSVPAQCGIAPGVAVHNILLNVLCRTGGVDAARKMLDDMLEKKDLEPNIVSYNTVLTACLKSGDEAGFDDILKVIDRKGVAHNVVTYNLRMADFCRRMESLKAEELLDELVSKGIQPNLSTFNTIINGFCKQGDSDSAIRIFKRMKGMKRGNGKVWVLPSPDTYNVLLRALVDKVDFASAQKICRECLLRGFAPSFEVMKALVSGLVKDSKAEEAKDLVHRMRKVTSKGGALDSWRLLEAELPLQARHFQILSIFPNASPQERTFVNKADLVLETLP